MELEEDNLQNYYRAARILDTVSDGIVAMDRDFRITYVNAEAARINGKPAEAFLNKTHWEEWPSSVGTELERQYRRAMTERVTVHFEHHYYVRGEYDVWMDISAYPDEESGGLYLVYRDITQRKRAEADISLHAELLRMSQDAVIVRELDGSIRDMNPAAELLYGFTLDEARGRRAHYLLNTRFPVSFCIQQKALIEHGDWMGELVQTNKLGRRIIVSSRQTLRRGSRTEPDLILESNRNITSEKAMEEEREAFHRKQRQFIREMLWSVTEGKLCLSETTDDLPAPLSCISDPIPLTLPTLRNFRHKAMSVAEEVGFSDDRQNDLITAVGECAMNAVVHAGGGEGRVCADPRRGVVQTWVCDKGTGIAHDKIHKATLQRGYTTAGTMGCGFILALKTVDRMFLLTGPTGTTIVIEQERTAPESLWLRER